MPFAGADKSGVCAHSLDQPMIGSRTLLRLSAVEGSVCSGARYTSMRFYLDAFTPSAYFSRQDARRFFSKVLSCDLMRRAVSASQS
jgi:hypothetical protein